MVRQPGRRELADLGDAALEQVRGPLWSAVRRKLAQYRDPRARLLRQRRRVKGAATAGAATTGVFGAGSAAALTIPNADWGALGFLMDMSGVGMGTFAVLTGIGTLFAGVRYRRLKREPLPDPAPEPVELPPSSSSAYEPMRRLRDAEQSLHQALGRLRGDGVALAGVEITDARGTADSTAAALRELAGRLAAVETALPHTPESERSALEADIRRLRDELDEGVESYGRLVAAASRALAASGASEQRDLLQDATDRLAGLAAALRELSGSASGPTDVSSSAGHAAAENPTSAHQDPSPIADPPTKRGRRHAEPN